MKFPLTIEKHDLPERGVHFPCLIRWRGRPLFTIHWGGNICGLPAAFAVENRYMAALDETPCKCNQFICSGVAVGVALADYQSACKVLSDGYTVARLTRITVKVIYLSFMIFVKRRHMVPAKTISKNTRESIRGNQQNTAL